MGNSKSEKAFVGIFLAVILLFMASILVRFAVRQIVVERLGVSNMFTSFIFFDNADMNILPETKPADSVTNETPDVDWAELYPFPVSDNSDNSTLESAEMSEQAHGIEAAASKIREKISSYTKKLLIGRQALVHMAGCYEDAIRWNYTTIGGDNNVIEMSDGYLTHIFPTTDTEKKAVSTADFAYFCKKQNIDFLYAQAPFKICKYDDTDLSGHLDFSNQNADAFLSDLRQRDVDTIDFREILHEEGLDHHSLFYRTDHHWKAETGLWAARHILRELREQYGLDVDSTVLDPERFESVLYPEWFLGSQGKKLTLARTNPEDFTLLYPSHPTSLHYEIKSLGIDCDGDFSVLYDMSQVEDNDYYNKNPYAAHIYGDRPMERIENHLQENGIRILIIHDSFGDCVVPFLAMGIQYVDSLDLRLFTGSAETFICETKPDVVLVLYNPSVLQNTNTFDFR